jgi:hypothetical protein
MLTMKFAIFAIAAGLAGLVQAQSKSGIAPCARACLDDSTKKITACGLDDFGCICKNIGAIQGDAVGCILAKCGSDAALSMTAFCFVRNSRKEADLPGN